MNKRDAVNEILLSLNELPLDTTDLIEDIGIAVIVDKELDIANKKVLSYGWNFNSLVHTLVPDVQGYIVIPNTFLSVDGDSAYVVRDWKLYDVANRTFKFTESVDAKVIESIVFDDVPYHVANYIVQVASLQAYINIIGNSDDISLRNNAVQLARIEAIREDANKISGNLLANQYATDLLDRTGI